jgi:hypothetical protein
MEKRNLRMVKTTPPASGVCEACNAVFKSHLHQAAQSKWEIQVQFERHKCKLQSTDHSQTSPIGPETPVPNDEANRHPPMRHVLSTETYIPDLLALPSLCGANCQQ